MPVHRTSDHGSSSSPELLPTPVADNSRGLPQPGTDYQSLPNAVVLLPTPVVNDMGAGKTVDQWDEWTTGMQAKHGNGNGHGPSLSIEVRRSTDWGPYSAAIARWETVLGRPAPPATMNRDGRDRLNPRLVEWMMGLPEGWVTDAVPSTTAQLKMLGNGVVPQQAALALELLDPEGLTND